ncbi:MAG: TolC family protein [Oscillibacter sp.]|nr:TolC family protein [Oscillibacter sp.]
MRKRFISAALALTLCGSLMTAPALAASDSSSSAGKAAADAISAVTGTEDQLITEKELFPDDPEGTVSFENLEKRVREHNANILTLEETIATLEAIDYDEMSDELRDGMNAIMDTIWAKDDLPPEFSSALGLDRVSYDSLLSSHANLKKTFDDIKEGTLQQDNADTVRQLRSAQNQVVIGAEALYIALVDLEIQETALLRQLAALDRTVQEMELRHKLGQISALTLQQVKTGRTTLASGISTLQMNITVLKMQLEQMLGVELTGTIKLGPLPSVQPSQVEELAPETDLAAAMEKSYTIYTAQKTRDDAEDEYIDAMREYANDKKNYHYIMALHTWNAAQHTYDSNIHGFELSFRSAYLKVTDFQQALAASEESLTLEQANYKVAELKHRQGTISKNALLDAQDKLTTAEEAVQSASIDLFTAYHTYLWAVEYGIIN